MFVRAKKSGAYHYLQLVRSERVDGHVRQQVIATLGRLDALQNAGKIDSGNDIAAMTVARISRRNSSTMMTARIAPSNRVEIAAS